MDRSEAIDQLNQAIGAHGTWKLKLRMAITTGTSEVDPDRACHDNRCQFGKWIHGDTIDRAAREGKPYQVVRRLHAEFHQSASHVLRLALTSRKEDAEQLYSGDFAERADKLSRALAKWKGELL